jgi:hypothetical protein
MRITITMMPIQWTFVLVLATTLASGPAVAADLCGDADGSGSITVTDGVQTLRAAAGLASTCTLARCDVDDGGTVSVTDGVNVLRAAAGITVALDCPGAAPPCESATATVALHVPEPIGAAVLVLGYPTSAVTLPGSGDAAADRVAIVNPGSLFGDDQFANDLDDRVVFSLVANDPLGDGDLLAVRFDCLAPLPKAADFTCTLSDVTRPDGVTPVEGATCSVRVE